MKYIASETDVLSPYIKTKFAWNKKQWWKICLQILIINLLIYGIETLDYFYVGEWWGKIFNSYSSSYTLNLQLPIDKIMPWQTWIFPYYISWPFVWFVILPLIIYFSGGKHAYYRYTVNSLIMYIISMFVYVLMPTTCTPAEFLNPRDPQVIEAFAIHTPRGAVGLMYEAGNHSWDWGVNKLFHSDIIRLSQSGDNIWGSAPSFHNYWAALFVFFGLHKNVKWYYRYPMILAGLFITFSTLTLHQHNLADVVITYTMVGLILIWEKSSKLVWKFENFYNRLFKVKDQIYTF